MRWQTDATLRFTPAIVFVLTLLSGLATAGAADTVRLAFSSFSATNAGFFTAIDEKLFERRGIDLTHVYIASSSVVLPAVLTREVDLATLSGETVVRAYHQGAKNLTLIGTQLDKFTFSLYTKPEIKSPQDLRGKILGVSRFGGSLDISLRYGLQQVGLDPKRDNITLVQAGGMPEIMAGLTSGKLDGAMLLSVYAFRGKELGYRELLDLGAMAVSFPQGVTLTTREFLRDKRDLAKRFIASYLDGLELFLKNPRIGKKALARFTGVKEEKFLDADYAQYAEKYLNKSMTTETRMLSIVFDRIGVTSAADREKLFKGLVDNSILAEAKALRAATVR
ncbi:MAG TPA: ABC transporter substrate-binding protein [Candidatus Binatia bacterium]|jgi:ABC-type nitrate/sulfonate/bicarbonate transport system substrate-binding protein|nr:ABC transporter substrate-binding protein [Candidatus Binatia bacterium]